jgi:hypothetical protein
MSNKVDSFELRIKLADGSRVIARVNIHSPEDTHIEVVESPVRPIYRAADHLIVNVFGITYAYKPLEGESLEEFNNKVDRFIAYIRDHGPKGTHEIEGSLAWFKQHTVCEPNML